MVGLRPLYHHYCKTHSKQQSIPNRWVAGPYGVTAVLTITQKSIAMEKLDHLGTHYVMIDYQIADGKFGAITTWNDSITQLAPYYCVFLQPDENGQFFEMQACTPEYYNTLTIRLQYYDGSVTEPRNVAVVETDSSEGCSYPIITAIKAYTTGAEAQTIITQFNAAKSATFPLSSRITELCNSQLPVHRSTSYRWNCLGQEL
jgi:dolichyl-diphosphooligosaccharide--protein glycosyltransferase